MVLIVQGFSVSESFSAKVVESGIASGHALRASSL